MNEPSLIHVSSLPPTECGIAEYTSALSRHLQTLSAPVEQHFVRLWVQGAPSELMASTPPTTETHLDPFDESSLARFAERTRHVRRGVVLMQHEFKLYGYPDGEEVLEVFARLQAPVVTTLHSVCPSFPAPRDRIFREVLTQSTLIVVLSDRAAEILTTCYGLAPKKVRVIPHGIPDVPFRRPGEVNAQKRSCDGPCFISFGLMRPTQGCGTRTCGIPRTAEPAPDLHLFGMR
jgi:hypothetical protein